IYKGKKKNKHLLLKIKKEDQAGPSEQPSMRDMMQVLLRIGQNQANMDTHLTRVDRRLSRIERYLEIDEDEDQD
ncbi:hypothetical protein PIB30_111405, partial [Stylosanthes scabra]|nr:hypothetical protein [Stylosanthes scabra]